MSEDQKIENTELEIKKEFPYVSLHNHTTFSIFQSLIKVPELFEKAKELGQKAVAITDKNSLAGVWDGLKESKKTGIKLIAGIEISFVDDVQNKESKLRNVVLLAKNAIGYRNLLTLSKIGFDNAIISRKAAIPRIDWNILETYREGLICITGDTSGIISRLLNDKKFDEAEKQAQKLKNIFGDDLALELQPNGLKRQLGNFNEVADQIFTNRKLKEIGEKLNIRLVAATNSYYTNKGQYDAHDTWLALGAGQPKSSGNRLNFNVNDFYIKSGEEIFNFFKRNYGEKFSKQLLANSIYLADKCEEPVWIDPKYSNPSGKELPEFPVKDQKDYGEFCEWLKNNEKFAHLTEDSQYLRYKCYQNYQKMIVDIPKYKDVLGIYKRRIEEELDVLETQGFSGYMLITADFLYWARKNNISVGPGRGSVGGSLIGYLLEIHIANPIIYDLVFARFQNKLKQSYPDIDNDVAANERYLVEQYIINKYGVENVAHVSNFNTMTPKPYVKAIARTFMYGGDRKTAVKVGNDLADIIPSEAKTVSNMFQHAPLLNEYTKKYKELNLFAKDFEKNPIAVATHAAGLVISKRSLSGLVPVRKDRDGTFSLEYEKERAEENGMIKMDLLGLSTLDIIDNTYKLIKENKKNIPYEKFDYEIYDQKTYDLISRGDTFCVFQFGTSVNTIELCKKYRPKNIEDLAIITTLARPACKEIRDDFFKVKNGEKQIFYMHPLLERAFKKTLGFPLYDESLLILAEDVAGWDLNEADKLRKLTKEKGKNPAKAKKWKEEFIQNALDRKSVSNIISEKIWEDIISPFGKYSFNKSHAVLYSMISFHTAYLKAHYPLEFLLANLMHEVNSGAKIAKDNINKIKKEIKNLNVNIITPNINTSGSTYTIINDSTLSTGLDALKYMGKDALPEILAKRPFSSFEDFLTRTDSSKVKAPAIQALAAVGALSEFNMPRKQMFLYAADYKKKLQVWLKKKPKKRGEFKYEWPDVGEWTIPEINALEQFYIGEGLTGSKFQVYPGFFTKNHHNFSNLSQILPMPENIQSMDEKELRTYTKKVNYIQGIVKDIFEFKVKKEKSKIFGQVMGKLTIEDPYGNLLTVTCFPEKLEYLKERVKDRNSKLKLEIGMGLSLIGNLQWYDGNISLIFEELQDACFSPQLPPDLKSKKTENKKAKIEEVSEIIDENADRNELLEEIEDELVEQGFADLNDEDYEFTDI